MLPAYPFYGGPPVSPDISARATIAELITDLDREGTERALILPNYGVPDPAVAFAFNELVVEAAQADDRIRCGAVGLAPARGRGADHGRPGAGGRAGRAGAEDQLPARRAGRDPACKPALDQIFAVAEQHDLVVHVHTSPGGASDIDEVGSSSTPTRDRVAMHLVHFGGGMSGHIKLTGGRFFDWIAAGKRVYTDLSWAIGFAPALAGGRDRAGAASATTGCCSPATSPGATSPASTRGCGPWPGTASWPT